MASNFKLYSQFTSPSAKELDGANKIPLQFWQNGYLDVSLI